MNPQTPIPRWLPAIFLLLLVRVLATTSYHAAVAPSGLTGVDFTQFYQASQHLREGKSLYEGFHDYPYSPMMALIMRPLGNMPFDKAMHLWTAASIGLLLLAIAFFHAAVGLNPLRSPVISGLILISAFRFWPTTIELAIGNVDMLLLCIIAAIYLADSRQQFKIIVLLIVAAALIKTWSLALCFLLIVRRRYRDAALVVGIYAVGLAALFTLSGWHQFPDFIHITRLYSSQPNLVTHSILGMARMYFSPNPHIHPLSTNPNLFRAILIAGYGLLLAGLLLVYWIPAPPSPLHTGFALLSLLLGLPICHQYYFVFTLPVIWTLLGGARQTRNIPALASLVAVAAYLAFSVNAPGLTPMQDPYKTGWKSLLIATSFTAAAALWLTTLATLWRSRTRTAPKAPSSQPDPTSAVSEPAPV